MDTLVRDPEPRDAEEFSWAMAADKPATDPARSEESGESTPTYLHPGVIAAAASGYAWVMLAFWAAFFGHGYMGLSLVVATLISGAMLGLMAAGGVASYNVTPWQRSWRSFREFLAGDVQVWGGRVSGWDAFVQLAGMAWCLAGLATVFAIIVAFTRP
jgi:hypothetical protein